MLLEEEEEEEEGSSIVVRTCTVPSARRALEKRQP